MHMRHLLLSLLTLFLIALPADAQWKSRRQLLRENQQLRQRIEALEQEIAWYQEDINERDSLRRELLEARQALKQKQETNHADES